MTRRSWYLILGLLPLILSVVGLAGCGQQGRQDDVRQDDTFEELLPVALPNLDGLEESARSQVQVHHATLRSLAGRRGVNPETLGAVYGKMGQLLLTYDFEAAAEPALRNAARLLPDDVHWPYYLGYLYQHTAQLAAAARSYERARALAPDHVPTQVHLAEVYRDLGRDADAKALLDDVLRLDPQCAAAFFLLGQLAQTPSEAIAHYRKVLQLQPAASRVHYPLGQAYRNQGDLERSRYHLDQRGDVGIQIEDVLLEELEDLRQGPSVKLAQAERLMEQGQLREAAVLFEQVLAEDPNHVEAYVDLGAVYEQLNQLEKAAQALAQALRLDPSHAVAQYNMGVVFVKQGNEAKGFDHFQTAVGADPAYKEAHFALAQLYWGQRQYRAVIPHLEQFLSLSPEHVQARLVQTMSHVQVGEYARARALLEDGLVLFPENVRLQNAMIRVLAASADESVRDGPRALEIAERLAAALPRASTFEILAMAYAEVGRYEEAVAQQKKAIRAAEQEGLNAWLDHLNANLRRYEQGQPCRIPWGI